MSTKTIQVKLPGRTGETDLRVILSRGSTVVNSSGAALTEASSSRGFFEGDVTSTFLVGFYDVEIANTLGTVLSGGYVYATGDDDEDLLVDDPAFTVVDEPSLGAVIESLETIAELQAAIQDKTDLIGTASAINPSPLSGTQLTIVAGDDYVVANGRAIVFTVTTAVTPASTQIGIQGLSPITGTAVDNGDTVTLTFELDAATTAQLTTCGLLDYTVQITDGSGNEFTVVTGRVRVLRKYT